MTELRASCLACLSVQMGFYSFCCLIAHYRAFFTSFSTYLRYFNLVYQSLFPDCLLLCMIPCNGFQPTWFQELLLLFFKLIICLIEESVKIHLILSLCRILYYFTFNVHYVYIYIDLYIYKKNCGLGLQVKWSWSWSLALRPRFISK